ncbi:MAG: YqeG family HAD IIIA-type phosphatase [Armatimonadota bacterium]
MFKFFRPRHTVRCFDELNHEVLREFGIRGVMIDLDNTLVPWPSIDLHPTAEEWVQCLQGEGIQVCLVTNALHRTRAHTAAVPLGVPFVHQASKPHWKGFKRGMEILGTRPEETAMVGDQVFTDIFGGNLLGLFTVLVNPLGNQDAWLTKVLQRPFERPFRRCP